MRGQRRRIGWVGSLIGVRGHGASPSMGAGRPHLRILHHQRNCFRANIYAKKAVGRLLFGALIAPLICSTRIGICQFLRADHWSCRP